MTDNKAAEPKYEFTIYNHAEHAHLLPQMAELHAHAIMDEGGILDLMPPLADDKMLGYWQRYAKGTGPCGNVDIVMVLGIPKDYMSTEDKTSTVNSAPKALVGAASSGYSSGSGSLSDADHQVLGVMVLTDTPYETRRLQVAAELLLVHPRLRCSGLVGRLVDAGFALAYDRGKRKMTFVSQDDNKAARVYRHWGMHKIGSVPEFELSPVDGKAKSMVFWYGNVRSRGRCQTGNDTGAGGDAAISWARPKSKL